MKSIVLTTLSVFLGLFFIFVGSMKVTPNINREMHREISSKLYERHERAAEKEGLACVRVPQWSSSLGEENMDIEALFRHGETFFYDTRRNFVQYSKVFPFCKLLNFKMNPKIYRLFIGWSEVVCGTILVLVPGRIKQLANVVLLVLVLGAVYTHAALRDKFERMAPSIVFSLMLGCRLVVFYQVQGRERKKQALHTTSSSAVAAAVAAQQSQEAAARPKVD